MKILLISCHSRLEKIESKIFKELGHDVTVIGFNMTLNSEDFNRLFKQFNPSYVLPGLDQSSGFAYLPNQLTKEFDLIVIQHYPHILQSNYKMLYDKKIIIRSIGMPNPWLDEVYNGFKSVCKNTKLVRMSELEPKGDALITQCYEQAPQWIGDTKKVLTVRKMFKKRAVEQSFDLYEKVMAKFTDRMTLAGSENEDIPYCINPADEELGNLHTSHAVYFYPPNTSSFVTFSLIEAMAIGCPIVTASEKLTGIKVKHIEHGRSGLVGDSIEEIQFYIESLLTRKLGQFYSKNIRMEAEQFSYEKAKQQWQHVLESY